MSDLIEAIAAHDAAIARSGLEIWVGSEPTFTLRDSEQAQWLSQALGGDKEAYALRLVGELRRRHPGSVVLRSVGRQYAGEKTPRWSFGLYRQRNGQALWQGPADPVGCEQAIDESKRLQGFGELFEQGLRSLGWHCRSWTPESSAMAIRIVARADDEGLAGLDSEDPRLSRPSVHQSKTPDSGLTDDLAGDGYYLFDIGITQPGEEQQVVAIELPLFDEIDTFLACLGILGAAANSAGLAYLLIAGFPPPVDDRVAWTTVTPDPAVIEINQAPEPDSTRFHRANRELFEIATTLGLSPYRLHYNGKVSDSGGGGQFTLGGRTPRSSPFFVEPRLLPRLVRYVNAHPSLSYLFATDYVGGASQSPRADEGARDRFLELGLALDSLASKGEIDNEFLYLSLAPFLADASGNSHRSELNIEKLWNTGLPNRGCLGLLEFRAFRMPFTPERSIALAMLLRSVTAMLAQSDVEPELHDWQDELHDRFALPHYLRRDLRQVLDDLSQSGLGLGSEVQAGLLLEPERSRWCLDFGEGEFCLEQAIEYWPLVGDVATQESGGSRLVDSSTLRLQVSLAAEMGEVDRLGQWQLQCAGYRVPLQDDSEAGIASRLTGLRFRDFTPWRGLHPSIEPLNPVVLYLSHPAREMAYDIRLYNWRPGITPYEGLPRTLESAATRRQERFVVTPIPRDEIPAAREAPSGAVTAFSFDLRRL